jgi:hypothetical protein
MSCQGSAIGPLFDEHQAERVFAVGKHGVSEAAWFEAGATYVLQTQSSYLFERIALCRHASSHEDHRISPTIIVARDSRYKFSCAGKLDRLLRPTFERGTAGIGQHIDAALDAVEPAIDIVQQDFWGVRNGGLEIAHLAGTM